jgi:large subunit ribosomal protein L4
MLLPVKDMAGKQTGEIEVSDVVFGAPVNNALMHQALVRQLSNARLGTHSAKTRGQVAGGGRKPWRQKGTGRARQGSTRAPQWVGGGTVFGPTPRSYVQAMPKKMQRAALRSALSAKAGASQIVVLELSISEPKTKQAVAMLKALDIADQKVLLVVAEKDPMVMRSVNNLPNVTTLLSGYLNVRDVLGSDVLVMARAALGQVEAWLGAEGASRAVPAGATTAAAESVAAETEA